VAERRLGHTVPAVEKEEDENGAWYGIGKERRKKQVA
jgi:hypothetical protein